ncbi:hypothetical protein ACFE04_022804 [Oxalis oulophora]
MWYLLICPLISSGDFPSLLQEHQQPLIGNLDDFEFTFDYKLWWDSISKSGFTKLFTLNTHEPIVYVEVKNTSCIHEVQEHGINEEEEVEDSYKLRRRNLKGMDG